MSSILAPDLNNEPSFADIPARLNRTKAEQFGYLRLTNTVLLVTSALCLGTLGFVGYELRLSHQALTNFKPYIVRVNDVGKAEVVYYRDFNKTPGQPEVIRDLSDFTVQFYTRMKGRIEAYWNSKYMLSQELMLRTYQQDQQTGWIKKIETGMGQSNDVVVNRVALVSLTAQGGVAYVDFDRTYYTNGIPSARKESDTATYRFIFAPRVEGAMLQHNPLGLCITDMQVTENFH